MSYIDALLYVRRFDEALGLLESAFPEPKSAWPHGQYGRAFMGLHRYSEAVNAFRHQLAMTEDVLVYGSLARALHRIGKRQEERDVLVRGAARYPRSRALRRDLASWKEKMVLGMRLSPSLRSWSRKTRMMDRLRTPIFRRFVLLVWWIRRVHSGRKIRHGIRPEFLRPVIRIASPTPQRRL